MDKPVTIRCKFECNKTTKQKGWGGAEFVYSAELSPVMGDCPENEKFYASTPTGSIEVGTVSQSHFEVGKEYFVDFTAAPEKAAESNEESAGGSD